MIPLTFQLSVLVVVRKWNHTITVFTCHAWCVVHPTSLRALPALCGPSSTRRQKPGSPIKHPRGRADQSNPHTYRHPDRLLRHSREQKSAAGRLEPLLDCAQECKWNHCLFLQVYFMPEKFQKCCKSVMGKLGFLQITKGLNKRKRIQFLTL